MNCNVTVYFLLTVFVGSLETCIRELTCKHYADSSTWFGLAMVEMLVSCFIWLWTQPWMTNNTNHHHQAKFSV